MRIESADPPISLTRADNGKIALAFIAVLLARSGARANDTNPSAYLAHRDTPVAASGTDAPSSITLTIPAETEVATELLSGIHTQVSHVGDVVTARVNKPVYINGHVALPPGTLLDGRITKIRPAGRLDRPAELALRFERIDLPDGEAEAVRGVLAALESPAPFKTRLDAEGYLKGARSISWKGVVGGLAALSALAITRAPVAGSAGFGSLVPSSGALLLTYMFVWRRGSDVHLPPETVCRVRLIYPVTVRVAW